MPRNCSPVSSGIPPPTSPPNRPPTPRRPAAPRLPGPRLGRHAPRRAARPPPARRRLHARRRARGHPAGAPAEPALDLHAGVAELIDGAASEHRRPTRARSPPPAPRSPSRWSARPRPRSTPPTTTSSAPPAWPGTPASSCSPAAIDAAMDEAVEAASLLDPALPPSSLLVDTLGTLAGVLADLELMPLALDYQRRVARGRGRRGRATPARSGPEDGDPRRRSSPPPPPASASCAPSSARALLDDGAPESAAPHFAEARRLAEQALELLPPDAPGLVAAQVVHGWALVGLGEHAAATGPLRAAVRITSATADRAQLASAQLALGRALRRQGDVAARRRAPRLRADPRHRARPAPAAPRGAARAVHAARRAGRRRPGAALPAGLPLRRAGPGRRAAHPLGGAVRPPQEPAGDRARRRPAAPPGLRGPAHPPAQPALRRGPPRRAALRRRRARAGRRRRRPVQVDQRRDRAPRRRRRAAHGRRAARSPASATPTRCAAGPATSS